MEFHNHDLKNVMLSVDDDGNSPEPVLQVTHSCSACLYDY